MRMRHKGTADQVATVSPSTRPTTRSGSTSKPFAYRCLGYWVPGKIRSSCEDRDVCMFLRLQSYTVHHEWTKVGTRHDRLQTSSESNSSDTESPRSCDVGCSGDISGSVSVPPCSRGPSVSRLLYQRCLSLSLGHPGVKGLADGRVRTAVPRRISSEQRESARLLLHKQLAERTYLSHMNPFLHRHLR